MQGLPLGGGYFGEYAAPTSGAATQTINGTAIDSAELFGDAALVPGEVTVSATSIESGERFGLAAVSALSGFTMPRLPSTAPSASG